MIVVTGAIPATSDGRSVAALASAGEQCHSGIPQPLGTGPPRPASGSTAPTSPSPRPRWPRPCTAPTHCSYWSPGHSLVGGAHPRETGRGRPGQRGRAGGAAVLAGPPGPGRTSPQARPGPAAYEAGPCGTSAATGRCCAPAGFFTNSLQWAESGPGEADGGRARSGTSDCRTWIRPTIASVAGGGAARVGARRAHLRADRAGTDHSPAAGAGHRGRGSAPRCDSSSRARAEALPRTTAVSCRIPSLHGHARHPWARPTEAETARSARMSRRSSARAPRHVRRLGRPARPAALRLTAGRRPTAGAIAATTSARPDVDLLR